MRIVRDRIRGVSDSSCVNHSIPCTTRSFKPSWQTTWFTQAAAEQCMLSNGLANVDTEAGNICDVTKLRMLDRQDGQWRCRHAVLCRHATHCTVDLQSNCTRESSSDNDRAALAHSNRLRKVAWILECAPKRDLQHQPFPDLKAEMTKMPQTATAAAYCGARC